MQCSAPAAEVPELPVCRIPEGVKIQAVHMLMWGGGTLKLIQQQNNHMAKPQEHQTVDLLPLRRIPAKLARKKAVVTKCLIMNLPQPFRY